MRSASSAQREFSCHAGIYACRAYASLIREAWPEGRLPLVEGDSVKMGTQGDDGALRWSKSSKLNKSIHIEGNKISMSRLDSAIRRLQAQRICLNCGRSDR